MRPALSTTICWPTLALDARASVAALDVDHLPGVEGPATGDPTPDIGNADPEAGGELGQRAALDDRRVQGQVAGRHGPSVLPTRPAVTGESRALRPRVCMA